MKNAIPTKPHPLVQPGKNLLEAIRVMRASVGDSLTDGEFTGLVRQTTVLTEAGFGFVSLADGFATLSVPQQEPANWYSAAGWILPEKARIAQEIADKHQLVFCEPPDQSSRFLFPDSGPEPAHHHLELGNRLETVIVAHPSYLKVRLFGTPPGSRCLRNVKGPLPLARDLLEDLSALYQV